MIYRLMERLQVYPPRRVVNVGDTVVDMETSANAGVWSIGVSLTGNLCGLSQPEFARLKDEDGAKLVAAARNRLLSAGAHYVVERVAELPPVIDAINDRLRRGETP